MIAGLLLLLVLLNPDHNPESNEMRVVVDRANIDPPARMKPITNMIWTESTTDGTDVLSLTKSSCCCV